jgi:hypothetical protein
MERLARIARSSRAGRSDAQRVESVVIPGGRHSWLYEFPAYRGTVAHFLAETLGGTYAPDVAADRAVAVAASRATGDGDSPTTAIAAEPGGFRSLAGVAARGATSRRAPEPDETGLEAPPVVAAEQ